MASMSIVIPRQVFNFWLRPIFMAGLCLSLHTMLYAFGSYSVDRGREGDKRMATQSILATDCKYSFLLFATIYSPTQPSPMGWLYSTKYTSLYELPNVLNITHCSTWCSPQMGWPPPGQASCPPSQVRPALSFQPPTSTFPPIFSSVKVLPGPWIFSISNPHHFIYWTKTFLTWSASG